MGFNIIRKILLLYRGDYRIDQLLMFNSLNSMTRDQVGG